MNSDIVLIIAVVVLSVLFIGEPDLHDALIAHAFAGYGYE